jgi:hypothetical protein
MEAVLTAQLRMEGGREHSTLPHNHDLITEGRLHPGEHLDVWACLLDPRRADEHRVNRPAVETVHVEVCLETVHLAAERIPAHDGVQATQQRLVRRTSVVVQRPPAEEDRARARAEGRQAFRDALAQRLEEPVQRRELADGHRFPAGDENAVEALELDRPLDRHGPRPDVLQHPQMLGYVTLQGQDPHQRLDLLRSDHPEQPSRALARPAAPSPPTALCQRKVCSPHTCKLYEPLLRVIPSADLCRRRVAKPCHRGGVAVSSPIIRHAEAHFGIVSRAELLHAFGCGRSSIDAWVRRELLIPIHRGVYRIPGAPRTPEQQIYAAVRRAGPAARAGGWSVLGLHGIEGFGLSLDARPFVIMPPTQRLTGAPFVVLHSPVERTDFATVQGITAVSVTRALVDIANRVSAKKLRVAFDDARRKGLVRADRALQRLVELGPVAGAAQARLVLGNGAAAKESEGERRLDSLFRPSDPQPAWQVWVLPHRRVDAMFLEAWLALEYLGKRWHGLDTDLEADSVRELELEDLHIRTIRVTSPMLRRESRADTRRRILAIRRERIEMGQRLGWPPIVPVPRR